MFNCSWTSLRRVFSKYAEESLSSPWNRLYNTQVPVGLQQVGACQNILNDREPSKLLKNPKHLLWATEMAINLGEMIFKSSYSKLGLLYPLRGGNVNVFMQ